MNIRKATIDDLEDIMEIYKIAQDFMIQTGNPNQWGHSYPTKNLIKNDIKYKTSYVIYNNKTIHGVFTLIYGIEPTYQNIENGEWLNNEPYITLHRIASDGKVKGIFKSITEYCKAISNNIRIDTHENNIIMQKLIEKNGFQKCGIIHVADGTPRIAYQWTKKLFK